MAIKVEYKNKVFSLDQKSFQSLNSKGFGFQLNNKFHLNIYEVLFLIEKKKIKVEYKNLEINFENLLKITKVDLIDYLVYKDLKSKGYVVQSGSKYGASFRIYDKGIKIGEDHSLWIVETVKDSQKFKFKDILGKNRIAHSANKKLILAIVDIENSITYIESSWKRL